MDDSILKSIQEHYGSPKITLMANYIYDNRHSLSINNVIGHALRPLLIFIDIVYAIRYHSMRGSSQT